MHSFCKVEGGARLSRGTKVGRHLMIAPCIINPTQPSTQPTSLNPTQPPFSTLLNHFNQPSLNPPLNPPPATSPTSSSPHPTLPLYLVEKVGWSFKTCSAFDSDFSLATNDQQTPLCPKFYFIHPISFDFLVNIEFQNVCDMSDTGH